MRPLLLLAAALCLLCAAPVGSDTSADGNTKDIGEHGKRDSQYYKWQRDKEDVKTKAAELAKESLSLLKEQKAQLAQISQATAATFKVVKTMAEQSADVPRLVTLAPKSAPDWEGSWHSNVLGNVLKQLKHKCSCTKYFQLHFLCAQTLARIGSARVPQAA